MWEMGGERGDSISPTVLTSCCGPRCSEWAALQTCDSCAGRSAAVLFQGTDNLNPRVAWNRLQYDKTRMSHNSMCFPFSPSLHAMSFRQLQWKYRHAMQPAPNVASNTKHRTLSL